MQLYHSPASPFVRKALVAAIELGLRDRIELVPAVLSPVAPDAALDRQNPLGKIPTLVTDEGLSVVDSHVIVDYLDGLAGGGRLIPSQGLARTRALRVEALADGAVDAGILHRYETVLRPAELQWPSWLEGQARKAKQSLTLLETEVDAWSTGPLDVAQIAVVCAVGWFQFRKPIGDLREVVPRLVDTVERIAARDSFRSTEPR